ncbi:hypothetical protein BSKO_05208 [Bryopsis sp. KO-2023]|nr:hypothetical protein BSKO_05208 [Bryopsis sp. KO-2023]
MGKRKKRSGQDSRYDEESRQAFRRRADQDTLGYLKEIQEHLSILNDAEERELLVNNTFDGLGDVENTCLDADCTKILEGLAPHAGKENLLQLLGRLNHGERFGQVASNPFGSHMLGALLKALCNKSMEGTEEVVKGIVEFVASYLDDFLSDKYATHVLRQLLAVLSGRDVVQICKERQNPFKKDDARRSEEVVPEIVFPEDLKKLVDVVRSKEYQGWFLDGLISSTYSGPTLQAMIHACVSDRDLLEGLVLTLIGQYEDGEIDRESLCRKMSSTIPSHMMECIWQVSPEDVRTKLFKLLAADLPGLAADDIGNFSVQAMGRNATTHEQAGILVDNLGPQFSELLDSNRQYVVISVLNACSECQSHRKEVCKYLTDALQAMEMQKGGEEEQGNRAGIVEKLLCKGTRAQLGKHSSTRFSPFGCIILSTILKYPPDCNNAFLGGILRLNPTAVQQLAKDVGGAHVLETILQGPKYKTQKKNQLLENLDGVWSSIAKTAAGSRLVQNCFDLADARLKESITESIAKSEGQISNSRAGSILLSHLRISQFKHNKESWRKQGARHTRRTDDFLEAMEVGQPFNPVPESRADAEGNVEACQGGAVEEENPDVQAGDESGGEEGGVGCDPQNETTGGEEMEFHVDPSMFAADGAEEEENLGDGLGTLVDLLSNERTQKRKKDMEREEARVAKAAEKKKRKMSKSDAEGKKKKKKKKKQRKNDEGDGPDMVV